LTAAKKEIENLDADIESLIIDFKADLKDTSDYDTIKKSVTTFEKELKKSKNKPETLQMVLDVKKQFKEITKTYNARIKDSGILKAKLKSLDSLLEEIGGQITTEESQKLILKKHFDIINDQLQRYLNAEKRALITAYENLFDKYHTSAQAIEQKRKKTMAELNDFLTQLNYLS
jgi:type I restriction enzyme M protein